MRLTASSDANPSSTGTLAIVRGFLLVILAVGLIGTVTELLLLDHTEGWQLVPVFLITGSLVLLGWHVMDRRAASIRALQVTMVMFVLSGLAGMGLHYRGNVEFEREMHPAATGMELFKGAMKGATPALAPGTMVQLGLLGLAYSYRHPGLANVIEDRSSMTED